MVKQKELALCVRSVRLLECEASYYFPKSLDVCGSSDSASGDVVTPASVSESHVGTAGNLVMHVRSGDVFRFGKAHGSYGQVISNPNKWLTCATALSNCLLEWERTSMIGVLCIYA